jgi:hypothetical protein
MSLEYILRSINYTLKIKLCFHLKLIGFSRKLGIRINDEDLRDTTLTFILKL